MKVRDVMFPHMFPDFKLIGGQNGLGAEIKRIAVFDAPDMSYWLQGGEFIIGNGFIFKDDIKSLPLFLKQVKERGVAAVGIKFDRFTAFIDMDEIARLADSLMLPIFRIPFRYRWLDIINKIQPAMDWFGLDEKTQRVRESFLAELDSLGSLIQALSSHIGRALFFSTQQRGDGTAFFPSQDFKSPLRDDEDSYVGSRVKETKILPGVPQYIGIREETRDFASSVRSRIYFSEAHPYFELHVIYNGGEDDITRQQEKAIRRGLSAIKALMAEQSVLYSQQYHEISQTLERLVRGAYSNPDKLLQTLRKWDLPEPIPCRIAVIPRADVTSEIIGLSDCPYRFYCTVGHLYVLLIPWDYEYGSEKNGMALRYFKKYREPVAVGSIASSLEEIPDSFTQAQRVMGYMQKRMLTDRVILYEDVLLELTLEKILAADEASSLWERYWKPLEDLNDRSAVSLTDFAATLVDCGFNLTDCAEKLSIHYNTARKYCDLIEKNLDVSLKKFRTQLSFYIARNKEGEK